MYLNVYKCVYVFVYVCMYTVMSVYTNLFLKMENSENQDGGVGRHTAPPRTTRTDRELNGKGVRHQGNKK